MLAKVLLAVAPLLLASPARAAPRALQKDDVVCVDVPTETVTVVSTVYGGSAPSGDVISEQFSPVATVTGIRPESSSGSTSTRAAAAVQTATGNITEISGDKPSVYQNTLYFTNWGIYGADMQPQSIPAADVTRLLYAFADIASDGTV